MAEAFSAPPRKVLLAEFNEITWRMVEPLCRRGRLPTFTDFCRNGVKGSPVATEVPPNLDPWISWTTVYTGRPQEEHGVRFLEQPPETVTGPRIADLAVEAGKTVGIYGSIMHWPPRADARGFWVPSTFSPGPETVPPELQPIQELNLSQTRGHTPLAPGGRRDGMVRQGLRLLKFGLRPTTVATVASHLVRSRISPHRKWEKVSLQPLVNLDFFERLYRQYRCDFATFHTNHVAHYMHRYWRAMDPTPFLTKPSAEEVRKFGPAIEYGYRIADRVLQRLWKLADEDTVVILASGLGQQPYVTEEFPEGRQVVRIRDIHQLVAICGIAGRCTPLSMMAPQWNLQIPDPTSRARALRILGSAWVGSPETPLFAFEMVGDTICLNIFTKRLKGIGAESSCVFPDAGGYRVPFGRFCAVEDATPKEGYHDPVGLVILRGHGIRRGAQLGECTNLDLAPTMLHLLGLPIPAHMKGRVLEEALEGPTRVAVPAAPAAVAV
jgi:Type I phosphodiesterase / nucleotide pyrophosphatase